MSPTRRQNADSQGRVAARVQPMFNRVLAARPPAVREALGDIRRRFAPEVAEDALGRLELVLAEVMNNVARHGSGEGEGKGRTPQIHVSITLHDSGLCCTVTDDGISLPPECLQPRNLPVVPLVELPESGWGWFLIRDLTRALCHFREDQRNYLAFSIPLADMSPASQAPDRPASAAGEANRQAHRPSSPA